MLGASGPVCVGADTEAVSTTPSPSLPSVSVVQLAALHAGKPKKQGHLTVHPVLVEAALAIEGFLPSGDAQRAYPFAARLAHTWARADTHDGRVLSVRLVCWAIQQVLHLAEDRAFAESVLAAAESWCDGDEGSTAADLLQEAGRKGDTSWAGSDYAVQWALEAVAPSRRFHSPELAVRYVAEAIHQDRAKEPDDVIAYQLMTFLTGLLDEHDRLTGRTPVDLLTPERIAALRMLAALT